MLRSALAVHQEKVPVEVKGYFLSAAKRRTYPERRVWPLSEEQCDHLGKVLNETEIQMVRMFRQLPDEAKAHIVDYLTYAWATKRLTRDGVSVAEEEKK